MPFRSRFSSERKNAKLLEDRLREAGLNVERVEAYFDGKPGYYLMVQGNHSRATLEPAIAHQEFSGSPELTLQLPNAALDRKVYDIIGEEYNKAWPYLRNWGIIGISTVAAYTIACYVAMHFLPKDYALALVPTTSLAVFAGWMIGIMSDDRRFNRNNRPWTSDERNESYQLPAKMPYGFRCFKSCLSSNNK